MAARTATMPLMIDMITPAMALITVMMQAPMPWKQETTAPILAVLFDWLVWLVWLLGLLELCWDYAGVT